LSTAEEQALNELRVMKESMNEMAVRIQQLKLAVDGSNRDSIVESSGISTPASVRSSQYTSLHRLLQKQNEDLEKLVETISYIHNKKT